MLQFIKLLIIKVIDMLDYLSIGFVLKPQGIKGEIKVDPLTDDIMRFDNLDKVYIKSGQEYKPLHIKGTRYNNGFVFISLEGYETIESVEPLRNQYLWIPRSMSVKLPEDTFFIADIIGCEVITAQGKMIGKVTDVVKTGSNDVYEVSGEKTKVLIPALKKVVMDVDLTTKKLTVDFTDMKGLLPDDF